MSSATMCHPGLLFAMLLVQLAKAKAAQIPSSIYARRRGAGEGGDSCASCSSSSQSGFTTTVTQTHNIYSIGSSPSPSSANPTSMLPAMTTASHSTTPSVTPGSQINTVVRRPNITAGGIIGSVVGSLIILGLVLMLLIKCINRSRKARKRPQGFVQSKFLVPYPSRPHTPMTEMSQTQSSPIISSAVASRATSSPPVHHPHSYTTNASNTTDTSLSLSPLLLAAGIHGTRSIASSSARRTSLSYTDASSTHEPIQPLPSPYDTSMISSWTGNHASTGLGGALFGNSFAAASASSQSNGLHRAMTAFQKVLEEEDHKGNGAYDEQDDIVHDPPPKYDG